jgi:NADPH2:quinone reductase
VKAIRVREHGEPEVMGVEEVADPRAGVGEVVVRVRAVGVNPVDVYIRAGGQGYQGVVPYTPGMDASGVVEAVGSGVTRVGVGDRVYAAGTLSGAYAQRALCKESQVHRLPRGVTYAQGAGVGVPYATAYWSLFRRAAAKAGECVLVHGGSGGVGLAAVQMARAAGLVVIATAGSEMGRRAVVAQGAEHGLDHHDAGHFERVMELTRGRGVDVVLEMLANVNLGKDLGVLASGGRVVVIGSRGPVEINPRDTMGRNASILGMSLLTIPEGERVSMHAGIVAGLREWTLRPIVRMEMPMSRAAAAHRAVMEGGSLGKIVLNPDE